MGLFSVIIDLAGADIKTLLEFAAVLQHKYCKEQGPLGVWSDDIYVSPQVQKPKESINDFAARVTRSGNADRILFGSCTRATRHIDIDLDEGIIGHTNEEDAAFLEELATLWRSHIGRPARATYEGWIYTSEWKNCPEGELILPLRQESLYRALHFLLGFKFEDGGPPALMDVFLRNPAEEWTKIDLRKPRFLGIVKKPCASCRIQHPDSLCERFLNAPLDRVNWICVTGDEGERVTFRVAAIEIKALTLARVCEGLTRWKQIEADPTFDNKQGRTGERKTKEGKNKKFT